VLTLIIIIVAAVLLLGLGAFFFLRRNQVAVEAPPVREVKPKSKPLDAETASKWDKTKREAPLDTGPKRTKPKAQTAKPKSPSKDEGKTDPEAAATTEPETEGAKDEPKGTKAAAAAAAAAAVARSSKTTPLRSSRTMATSKQLRTKRRRLSKKMSP